MNEEKKKKKKKLHSSLKIRHAWRSSESSSSSFTDKG